MKRLAKILLTLICAYAFAGSLWLIIDLIQDQWSWYWEDIVIVHYPNFMALFACVYLPLLAWNVIRIKFRVIQIVLLGIAFFNHLRFSGLVFFLKRADVDYTKEIILMDIPVALSLCILLTLIIWLSVKKNAKNKSI